MRWIILAFALLFSTAAQAQCSGVAPANSFCGNPTGSPLVGSYQPIPAFPSASLDTLCSTNSNSLIRLAGLWQCMAYSGQFSVGSTLSIASLAYSLLTGTPAVRLQITSQTFFINSSSTNTGNCGGSTCSIGSDSNDCKTILTACLTAQHVTNLILSTYDAKNTSFGLNFTDTVGVAGSDPTKYSFTCETGAFIGTSVLSLQGNTSTPGNVQIQPSNGGVGVTADNGCTLGFNGFHFIDSAGSNAAGYVQTGGGHNASHIDLTNVVMDACAACAGINANSLSSIAVGTGNTIIGNMFLPYYITGGGTIDFNGNTVAVSNNLAFNSFFAQNTGGQITGVSASTFGSPTGITGTRCNIQGAWTILGVNPNTVFPGNSDCVIQETIGAVGLQKGAGAASTVDYGTQYAPLQSGGSSSAKNTWGASVIQLSPVLYANLASPQSLGMIAVINDGKASNCGDSACTTWGTTVSAGAGALKLMIWNNGSVWTLYGK